MNFFGIGAWEILLVLLIALLVLGPQRLPEVAVQMARAIRWLRRFAGQMTGQLRLEFADLVRDYEALRAEVQELRQQVDRNVGDVSGEVDKALEETRQAVPGGPLLETSSEPLPNDKPSRPSTEP